MVTFPSTSTLPKVCQVYVSLGFAYSDEENLLPGEEPLQRAPSPSYQHGLRPPCGREPA